VEKIISRLKKELSFKQYTLEEVFGGDINRSFRLTTEKETFFLKYNTHTPEDMFRIEADSLKLMASFKLPVPKVILHGKDFLLLNFIPNQVIDYSFCGAELAKFHKITKMKKFGLDFNNYIGSTPQKNTWCESWPIFFSENRIQYQLDLINNKKISVPQNFLKTLHAFAEKLKSILPHTDSSLLHGDLWSGNLYSNHFIDPAVCYGHHEADLAMTELFGRLNSNFYKSYNEIYPIDKDYSERKNIYNSYHLLNHFNLFESQHYMSQAVSIAKKYV
jgi:fructosamine-3-kinase